MITSFNAPYYIKGENHPSRSFCEALQAAAAKGDDVALLDILVHLQERDEELREEREARERHSRRQAKPQAKEVKQPGGGAGGGGGCYE